MFFLEPLVSKEYTLQKGSAIFIINKMIHFIINVSHRVPEETLFYMEPFIGFRKRDKPEDKNHSDH